MSIFNGNIAQIYTDMQGGKHPQFRGKMRIIPRNGCVVVELEVPKVAGRAILKFKDRMLIFRRHAGSRVLWVSTRSSQRSRR